MIREKVKQKVLYRFKFISHNIDIKLLIYILDIIYKVNIYYMTTKKDDNFN